MGLLDELQAHSAEQRARIPWDHMLLCPRCGEEYTHITGVRETDWHDYPPEHSEDASWIAVRGGAHILEGYCETGGCEFEIAYGQHKGNTFITTRYRERPMEHEWETGS